MTNTQLAKSDGTISLETLETVLLSGDLKDLTASQRIEYYNRVCQTLNLNPLSKPFDYINLSGKLTLYAKRDCTDQLRRRDHISISLAQRERIEDVYIVTARATTPDGRQDESTGAVSIAGARGDGLANLLMKCETKAKRRVTLSICGLGWLDESEIETIPRAEHVVVQETGEIVEDAPADESYRKELWKRWWKGVEIANAESIEFHSPSTDATNDELLAATNALARLVKEARRAKAPARQLV